MNESRLVTVVIIFYNEQKYITQSLESVLNQSYQNWELILVDDGSNDDSTLIAKSYVDKYSDKIFYLEHENHENRGMSASRNLGLQYAKGEFICFLDADDILVANSIKDQIELFERYQTVAMVYGYLENRFESEKERKKYKINLYHPQEYPEIKPNSVIDPPVLIDLYLQGYNNILPGICSTMMRTSALRDVGGFVDSFRGMYEDHAMKAKMCLNYKIYFSDTCWSIYRRHSESESINVKKNNLQPYLKLSFLYWLEMYMTQIGIDNSEVWKSLQKNIDFIKSKITKNETIKSQKIEKLTRELEIERKNVERYKKQIFSLGFKTAIIKIRSVLNYILGK